MTFCPLLANHLFINNSGYVNPCCHSHPQYPGEILFEDFKKRNVQHVGVHAAFYSSYRAQVQNTVPGTWFSECSTCQNLEGKQILSPRQIAIEQNKDVQDKFDIVSMDLRLGNSCNLKCRMCSPFSSKILESDWANLAHPMYESHLQAYRKLPFDNWSENVNIWDELFSLTAKLQTIHFAGGEPLLNKAHVSFLLKLIESKQAEKITLTYNTNLTVIPDWFFAIASQFKEIRLIVSIDGSADLNDFIRYPNNWAKLIKNLHILDSFLSSQPSKLKVFFNTTVQVYNVLYLSELFHALNEENFRNLPKLPQTNFLIHPAFFNATILPEIIKSEAVRKIQAYKNKLESENYPSEQVSEVENIRIKIQKFLNSQGSTELLKSFIQVNHQFDVLRKESYFDIAPEMKILMQKQDLIISC